MKLLAPAWLSLLCLIAAVACSGGSSSSAPPPQAETEPLKDCQALVATYRACFSTGAPADVVEQRASAMQASLDALARDPAQRAATKQKCTAAKAALAGACS